jgi:hypothetical protein
VDRVEDDFLAYYHAVRCLAANPDAAALFLEALDAETLSTLGRASIRRLSGRIGKRPGTVLPRRGSWSLAILGVVAAELGSVPVPDASHRKLPASFGSCRSAH